MPPCILYQVCDAPMPANKEGWCMLYTESHNLRIPSAMNVRTTRTGQHPWLRQLRPWVEPCHQLDEVNMISLRVTVHFKHHITQPRQPIVPSHQTVKYVVKGLEGGTGNLPWDRDRGQRRCWCPDRWRGSPPQSRR